MSEFPALELSTSDLFRKFAFKGTVSYKVFTQNLLNIANQDS